MAIERLLEQIGDRAAPLRSATLSQLSDLSSEDRAELAAGWPALPLERRRQTIEQLALLAEDTAVLNFDAVYLEALTDADAEVRTLAIRALWEYDQRDLIPRLVTILRDDPNDTARAEAALALGRFVMMGEFDQARPADVLTVTDALRAVVADLAEPVEVRARAVESLGASSQPWARDLIHDAYDNADPMMVASAVHAMGRSADGYWTPTLITELGSRDAELRYEAAAACGMIEDEEAVPALIELLEDEDIEVREQAVMALGEIGGDEAVEALRRQTIVEDERIAAAAQLALEEAEFSDDPMGFKG